MRVKERENFKDGNQNENLSSNILFSREMFYFLFFYINFLLIFHCSSLKKKKKKKLLFFFDQHPSRTKIYQQ